MQEYELESMIEAWEKKYKNDWEQTRTIAYTTAQVNCAKSLEPTDVIKFRWDNEDKNDGVEEEYNVDTVNEMREKIKRLNELNNDRI